MMILGAWDGDKAKKRRRIIIKTGTKRSIDGGGGRDGRSSGSTSSDAANTIITMIHLILLIKAIIRQSTTPKFPIKSRLLDHSGTLILFHSCRFEIIRLGQAWSVVYISVRKLIFMVFKELESVFIFHYWWREKRYCPIPIVVTSRRTPLIFIFFLSRFS